MEFSRELFMRRLRAGDRISDRSGGESPVADHQ